MENGNEKGIESDGKFIVLNLHKDLGECFLMFSRISSVSPARTTGSMVVTYESKAFFVHEDPQDIVDKINEMKHE